MHNILHIEDLRKNKLKCFCKEQQRPLKLLVFSINSSNLPSTDIKQNLTEPVPWIFLRKDLAYLPDVQKECHLVARPKTTQAKIFFFF